MRIEPYREQDSEEWDQFCDAAINATFLHTRRFLSYHGDRFKDVSLIFREKNILGVLPAAIDQKDPHLIVSHPGITYGGIVHQGKIRGESMLQVIDACLEYFRAQGFRRLRYKVIPYIYCKAPSQDDLYALFRHGAQRYRCDLSCTIDLRNRLQGSERRRRGLKKGQSQVTCVTHPERLDEYWTVLEENLRRKHGVAPVHNLSQMQNLAARFPQNIRFYFALINARVEAGVIVFQTECVHHAQYIAASEVAYTVSALDLVFDEAINSAIKSGARYFDFGTNNEQEGQVLNSTLYQFKSEFGASGVVHEYYQLEL